MGLGGWEKFGDGYRLAVTDGATASPDASASIWYMRMDGRVVRILEDCQGRTAGDLVSTTGVLAQPLFEPGP